MNAVRLTLIIAATLTLGVAIGRTSVNHSNPKPVLLQADRSLWTRDREQRVAVYPVQYVSNLEYQVSEMRHRQAIMREEIRKNRERISVLWAAVRRLEAGRTNLPLPSREPAGTIPGEPWWEDLLEIFIWILIIGAIIGVVTWIWRQFSSRSE